VTFPTWRVSELTAGERTIEGTPAFCWVSIESWLQHQGELPGRLEAVANQIQNALDRVDIDARSTICASALWMRNADSDMRM
jgi:hypothetical protein